MFKGVAFYFVLCWKYNKKFVLNLLLQEIITALNSILVILIPKYILDALFVEANKKAALQWALIYTFCVYLLSVFNNILQRFETIQTAQVFQQFSIDLNKKMMECKYQAIETPEFLDLKTKAECFLYGNGQGFGSILKHAFAIIGYILTLVGLSSIIMRLHIGLAFCITVLVIINSYIFSRTNQSAMKFTLDRSKVERRMSYYSETMQNFRYGKEIRTYNLQNWILEKYINELSAFFSFYRKTAAQRFKGSFIASCIFAIQLIISYYYVIVEVFTNSITVGSFSMYLSAITSFSSSLRTLIFSIVELNQFNIYYKIFKQYLQIPSIYDLKKANQLFLSNNFTIIFENVSFKYDSSNKFAVQNINITFSSKERIAIIGENGAGKSTFIKLLMRLYDPTEGRILLNGIDIRLINYYEYQQLFATVFQDFKLFSFSIRDNITFGNCNDDIEKYELKHIVESTGLQEVTKKLKKGLDTMIYRDFDDSGFTPSGGEEQKIAIARAAYKKAPIIILDEPTAALDPKAEHKIYEQFNDLFKDSCSLYISHRIAVTKFSDRVIVFENASIVQDGKPADLIKQAGKYNELYNLQAQLYR